VVESIEDKKRHVAPATARVSSLEEIAIFTHGEEVPLSELFMMIHDKTEGKETISHKSATEQLKTYFEELVPDYDDERVYVSDIRKVFQWYNQLHSHGLLEVVDKEEGGEETAEAAEPQEAGSESDATAKEPSKKAPSEKKRGAK
jgi:hypothetical protein